MKGSQLFTSIGSLAVLSCAWVLVSPLHGDTVSVPVPNYSFEDTTPGQGLSYVPGGSYNYLTGWTINVPNDSQIGVLNDTTNANLTGGTGTQGAFIKGQYGYYEQDLISSDVTTILPNTTYTLTVAMGVPNGYPPPSGSDAPGVILNMIDSSGKVDASTSYYIDNSQNPAFIYYQGSITYADLPQGTMEDFSLQFTTGATPFDLGEALHFQFSTYNGYDDASVGPVVFDDVRLTESGPDILAAPEPSTWAMAAAGLAFIAGCLRRKGMALAKSIR